MGPLKLGSHPRESLGGSTCEVNKNAGADIWAQMRRSGHAGTGAGSAVRRCRDLLDRVQSGEVGSPCVLLIERGIAHIDGVDREGCGVLAAASCIGAFVAHDLLSLLD